MATPWVTVVEVLIFAALAPAARSNNSTMPPCLRVATRYFPSGDTARLYGPRPVANRRLTFQATRSISRISSDLLQATYTLLPSAEGCAQVGEQELGVMLWRIPRYPTSAGSTSGAGRLRFPVSARWRAISPRSPGASGPSFPFATENRRETLKLRVSISTSWSSIMQPEY
jgi:hypothetical protein